MPGPGRRVGNEQSAAAGTVEGMTRYLPAGLPVRAILFLLLVPLLLALGTLLAAPSGAQDEEPAEAPAANVPEPAVPVPEDAPADPDPEWSYRFLVPATMLLGTVAVVGAVIMYFVRVTRNRYRVIR